MAGGAPRGLRRRCPVRLPARRRPGRAARSPVPRQPDGVHERFQLWDPADARWTDQQWRGRSIEGGDLRIAHRNVHRGRHVRRRDRQARLPGGPRRRLRRTDAGQRVQRHPRLGLRRGAVVRRARTLRRAGRSGSPDRRLPCARPRRADRRGVQPPRAVGQLPAAVRSLPVVGEQYLGRKPQSGRPRCRRGAALHHRLRTAVDA